MRKNVPAFFIVIITIAIVACGPLDTGNLPDSDYEPTVLANLDSKGDANESSPLAPEIVATASSTSQSFSGQRLVASSSQNFGNFGMIKNSASNYNSMITGTVPSTISQLDRNSDPEVVSYGPFTRSWKKSTGSNLIFSETDDGSVTCAVSDNGVGIEIRQFTAFSVADAAAYEYSCSIFYWDDSSSNPGVDVTEVWEFPTYKMVSVTMYWKNMDSGNKYLAVTDTTDEFQRTSMLSESFDYGTDSVFSFSSYSNLGYIDYSMGTVVQCSNAAYDSFLPAGFPSLDMLRDLHMRSIRMTDAKTVSFDHANLRPFTGFLE